MTGGHPNATQELLYTLWETVPAGATAQPGDLPEALAAEQPGSQSPS
jgi:hypothetical protein